MPSYKEQIQFLVLFILNAGIVAACVFLILYLTSTY